MCLHARNNQICVHVIAKDNLYEQHFTFKKIITFQSDDNNGKGAKFKNGKKR